MRLRRGNLELTVDPLAGTAALVDSDAGPDVDVVELDERELEWLVMVGGPAALAHLRRGRGLRHPGDVRDSIIRPLELVRDR